MDIWQYWCISLCSCYCWTFCMGGEKWRIFFGCAGDKYRHQFCTVYCFMRAIAISGGREVLFNRISDKLVLKEDDFSMEYIPQPREMVEYGYVVYQMEYRQIKSLVDYRERGYVEVYGEYQIRRYHQADMGDVPENVQVEHKYEEPFRLYGHYENFEECIKEISERSGVQMNEFE